MAHDAIPRGFGATAYRRKRGLVLAALGAAVIGLGGFALPAAAATFEPEFRTLALGLKADELTTDGYDFFACGSNGGPPLATLTGWTDYMKCAPEPNGLREVMVEFGIRTERLSQLFADQFDEELWIQQYGGTRVANFPVVMSLLFDEAGIVRAFRAVTDDRADVRDRGRSYLLRFRVYSHYGDGPWDCVNGEPSEERRAVGTMFVDEVCSKQVDGKIVRVETHVHRRPGQTGLDSQGMFEAGQFESNTRWEVWDASLPVGLAPDAE